MKSRLLVSTAAAIAAGLAMPTVASASDDDIVTCNARTLRGVYQFTAAGFNIVNGVALPKAIIETLVFDGRGGVLTPEVSISFNGNIIQPPQGNPGVYTVDSDCTGTITAPAAPARTRRSPCSANRETSARRRDASTPATA